MNHFSNHQAVSDGADRKPDQQDGGEDEGSSSNDGHDQHLHDDQKPINPAPASSATSEVSKDDLHKAEKLAKAGRDIDPNDGAD
jgi:hypothetical protein